jgi:hypothetical protein
MARKSDSDRAKRTALDKAMRGMFKRLEDRPLPDRLTSVVDQLDDAAPAPRKRSGRG